MTDRQDIEDNAHPEWSEANIEKLVDTLVDGMDMEDTIAAAKAWLHHVYSENPSIFREDWHGVIEDA